MNRVKKKKVEKGNKQKTKIVQVFKNIFKKENLCKWRIFIFFFKGQFCQIFFSLTELIQRPKLEEWKIIFKALFFF